MMKFPSKSLLRLFLTTILIVAGAKVSAFERSVSAGKDVSSEVILLSDDSVSEHSTFHPLVSSPLSFTKGALHLSQNKAVRSRSDVVREVKNRYNAEVLRIKLDEKRMVYRVRVLMPNGKVKNISVSARR